MTVAYPAPGDPNVTIRMTRNRRRDTKPELRLRRLLHAQGARYRVDFPIEAGEIRVRPDLVFIRRRVAVFLDGCFWHGCPEHGNLPNRNRAYWAGKLARNHARDRRVTSELVKAGWTVVRAWEHEPTPQIVLKVLAAICEESGST